MTLPSDATSDGQQSDTSSGLQGERALEDARRMLLVRAQSRRNPFMLFDDISPVLGILNTLPDLTSSAWTGAFVELARQHFEHAEAYRAARNEEASRKEYAQAYEYCHVARYPAGESPEKQEAYRLSLNAFDAAFSAVRPLMEHVSIPVPGGRAIPCLFEPSRDARAGAMAVLMGGLDMWKEEEIINFGDLYLSIGLPVLVVDAPGTGQSPFFMSPEADQMWPAVRAWIQQKLGVDRPAVALHGFSLGGYWAARAAHTEAAWLAAVVDHGGPGHLTLSPEWFGRWNDGDYAFGWGAAYLHATGAKSSTELYAQFRELSLLKDGLIDGPCAPLLLVNGRNDRTALTDDMYELLLHGAPKCARFYDGGHMGLTPETMPMILAWVSSTWQSAAQRRG